MASSRHSDVSQSLSASSSDPHPHTESSLYAQAAAPEINASSGAVQPWVILDVPSDSMPPESDHTASLDSEHNNVASFGPLSEPDLAPQVENSKVSVTAVAVAWGFARAVIASKGRYFPLKEAQLAEHLCNIGINNLTGLNYLLGWTLSWFPYSTQSGFFSRTVVPGYDQIMLLRKLMIKNKIDEAITNGVKQIVFLGGGYDIRGLMTALEHPGVKVYELDRGKTRECKLYGLSTITVSMDHAMKIHSSTKSKTTYINDNMFYVDCDLMQKDLLQVLTREGFQADASTLVIAEGCTMYLDVEANTRLLQFAASLSNTQNELLFSYYSHSKYSTLSRTAQSETKELYQFCITPEEVLPFVSERGFKATGKFTPATFLSDVGLNDAAQYYVNNPEHPKEWYFTLKQTAYTLAHPLHLADVPDIRLVLPASPAPADEITSAAAPSKSSWW